MAVNVKFISIIVPAYNEEDSVSRVISEISEKWGGSEIIIVDDGSTDKTFDKLKDYPVKVVRHSNNRGYGAALKTGINNSSNGIIVTIDADGEHSVDDIALLLPDIEFFDMVVGKRCKKNEAKLWKKFGKFILHKFANLASGCDIPDINSGLRVFSKQVIMKNLNLLPDSFSFHTTSTLAFLLNKRKIKYIPVNIYPRIGKSKVSISSGFISLWKIFTLTFIFNPARGFLLIGMVLGLFFLLCGAPFFRIDTKLFLFCLISLGIFLAVVHIFSKCDKDLIVDEAIR